MEKEIKKQDGRKNNGGARPGTGPKPTGRNYRSISFSIHNDDIDTIRAFVYEKKKELEDKRNGVAVPITEPVVKETKVAPKTKVQGNDFVAKRRNAKLGIK